ncbi:MAG: hypothetical protein HEEMFOPI_01795 [Holosporales bacterium]
MGRNNFNGIVKSQLSSTLIKDQFKFLLSLIPIPTPPVVSDLAYGTITSVLVDNSVATYNMIVNSCVYSGQNCKVMSKSVVV